MRIIAVAVAALTTSSCVTLYGGGVHRVVVTSTPSDAQVFVDGEHAGVTPVRVTVSSRDPRPEITVEKDGYPVHRCRLQRSGSVGRILASVGIGIGIGFVTSVAVNTWNESDTGLLMAVGGVWPLIDWHSSALYKFPDRVDARLAAPVPGPPCNSLESRRQERERPRRLRRPRGLRRSLNLNRPPAARPSPVNFQPLPRRTMRRELGMDQTRSPSAVHPRIGQVPDPGAPVLMDGKRG